MIKSTIAAGALVLALAQPAAAFDCPRSFQSAEAAIAKATGAMKGVKNKTAHGLVHSLIDDAKMYLASGRHNHAKPAAGGFDHARAVAKARSARSYAEAALILAKASK